MNVLFFVVNIHFFEKYALWRGGEKKTKIMIKFLLKLGQGGVTVIISIPYKSLCIYAYKSTLYYWISQCFSK